MLRGGSYIAAGFTNSVHKLQSPFGNKSPNQVFPRRVLIVSLVRNILRQFCTLCLLSSKQSQESGWLTVATRRYRFLSGCHDDKAQGFESPIGCSWVNPEGNHALCCLTWSCIVRCDMATNRPDRWTQRQTDLKKDLDSKTGWYTEKFRYRPRLIYRAI